MVNKITEKYFKENNFAPRIREIIQEVSQKTGFIVEEDLFSGKIYDKNNIWSQSCRGTWKNAPAVLKIQGLKLEMEEYEIHIGFEKQSRSRMIRLPKMYVYEPWRFEKKYGYMIMEYIEAPRIFRMPFATDQEMDDFVKVYADYRTNSAYKAWFEPETRDTLHFTCERVDNWRKICESKARLPLADYPPYLIRFYPMILRHAINIPMVFSHGHLTANDIFKLKDGGYVFMSNLLWSYRPQWYDLAFNIWACFLHIRDNNLSFDDWLSYYEKWLLKYRTIPLVKEDPDFEHKMTVNMLERTMGAIMTDIGTNDTFAEEPNNQYFKHLLNLHQQFFNFLMKQLERG